MCRGENLGGCLMCGGENLGENISNSRRNRKICDQHNTLEDLISSKMNVNSQFVYFWFFHGGPEFLAVYSNLVPEPN